jgi:protease IV
MKDLIRSILNIFRWVGRFLTGFRTWTLNIAFVVLIIFIISTISSQSTKKVHQVSTSGILVLTLSGDIVEEKQSSDPISTAINEKLGLNTLPTETLLQDVLDAIKTAATDDNVICILLDLANLESVGLNQLQLIGQALTDFKNSNKLVIAAEDFYPQKAYYLASYADEIYLNPMGGVDLHGIGTFRLYFKDAIAKLKVNYNVFRVGSYKSAMEPIIRNSMSPEAKKQNISWLTVLWDTISQDIIRERNLDADAIEIYTENIPSELATSGGDTARLALDSGLVDGLKTREALRSYLMNISGGDSQGSFQQISFSNYLNTIPRSYHNNGLDEPSVGIIIAQGPILNGEQPIGAIGGDSLAKMIRNARTNSNINALVLRVVSGGGSVFASEIIRQEVLEFKKTGKPIVISMGSMAASGGYWIAADADEIWASPVTLTGSIGIFAAIPTFEESLSAMGIYNDGIGTTSLASSLNLTRPISPLLKETIAISLRHGYDQFLDIVSEGRAIERNQVSQVAEGRVFDGKTAMDLGLVDNLGNMSDAIKSAAQLAGLTEYSAHYIRKPMTVKDEIMQIFSGKVSDLLLSASIPPSLLALARGLIQPIQEFLLFDDPKGLYAHCMIHDLSL